MITGGYIVIELQQAEQFRGGRPKNRQYSNSHHNVNELEVGELLAPHSTETVNPRNYSQ